MSLSGWFRARAMPTDPGFAAIILCAVIALVLMMEVIDGA